MPPGASLTYLATDMWTQEARTCRQCKPKAQCHLVHSFSSPSSVRSHLFLSLSPSHLFSRSQLNIRPISQATCLEQSKGSKSISAAQQWCRRASERQLVVHAQGRSLENQQWWNMFFFNDSKLMIFSSIHHAWFPWAYAKKKTRDSSGCFNSSEMASPLCHGRTSVQEAQQIRTQGGVIYLD